ncbi:hypothetical protein IQ241_10660 [Romeria aff. gracilis LEGE 07310]|uniref:Uncharacterized protein n=1 Tax=Vasconcelosia minhoensis LEGE 07310 TaxID=915328 RepID=A0A8J7DBI0_9CYAN|nr:hypothetical protein [Romeria gracilis]MBE9077752.1 hypothetical protein [Romeria aff. gracilis LEGE 07310]
MRSAWAETILRASKNPIWLIILNKEELSAERVQEITQSLPKEMKQIWEQS